MQAWKLIAPRKMELVQSPPIDLSPINNVKVKIEKSLVSSFDVASLLQPQDSQKVLGRYGVGVVSVALNDDCGVAKNDKVVINPTIACGECFNCKSNDANHCSCTKSLGIDMDGVYCDFINLPSSALYKIPDVLTFDKALFVPHVALCLNILDSLNIEKGNHVAIFAETKLGLILTQLVSYYGAIPILISKDEAMINTARSLGTFYTFLYSETVNLQQDLLNITSGRMCEKIIYLTTAELPFNNCIDACAHNGSICFALTASKTVSIDIGALVSKHISATTVANGNGNFPSAINLLATGKVDTSKLCGGEINFLDLGKQMPKLSPEAIKYKSYIVNVD